MNIPKYIIGIAKKIEAAGFEVYLVGGCVRDLLMQKEPKDWDLTTDAQPEKILDIFSESKYENAFGTVLVPVQLDFVGENYDVVSGGMALESADLKRAVEIAEKYLKKDDCPIHGLNHSINVANTARSIAEKIDGVNPDIVYLGAYFHDTGYANIVGAGHIKESQNILKKELSKIFDDRTITLLEGVIEHDFGGHSESLEQQIIKEADIIDGINIDRCRRAIDSCLDVHLKWVRDFFNNANCYYKFVTPQGKRFLQAAINNFNKANFGFKLPELNNIFVEITTYRSEHGYSDRRHPDEVLFEKQVDKDLERRDFTVNAMAIRLTADKKTDIEHKEIEIGTEKVYLLDLFGGEKDIKKRIIRAVGEPSDRFKEDALRMMRAIRFSAQLDFEIEPKTERSILKMAGSIKFIANERIKDELVKIMQSDQAYEGVMYLHRTGLLNYIMPELERGLTVKQDRHHIYPVFEHSVLSLKHCPSALWQVRLASLLHDIGKPQTKKIIKGIATFYNHEYAGARIVDKILKRLKFSNDDRERIVNLVRNHMFYYNTDEVTAASVRRLIKKVGRENLKDLIDIRIADRLGSGTPKAKPYRLRHLEYMFERVQNDPVSVKMLKLKGDELMGLLKIPPSPKVGAIMDVLLSDVIENPELNNEEFLKKRSLELNKENLEELRGRAKEKIDEKRKEDDKSMKRGYKVG